MIIMDTHTRLIPREKLTVEALYTKGSSVIKDTPFSGYSQKLNTYFAYNNVETADYFTSFLKRKADFDPNRITETSLYKYIDESNIRFLYKYIDEMRISFSNQSKEVGSYRDFNTRYIENNTLVDSEGNQVSETDLVTEVRNLSDIEIEDMRREIPYLLRSIHEYGKKHKISAFSCLIAMQKHSPTFEPITYSNSIMFGHAYTMSPHSGECMDLITKSSNNLQDFMTWLNGGVYNSEYSDFQKLIKYIRKLGIDLRDEDPREFGQSYIDNLVSDYITPNKQIVIRNLERAFLPSELNNSKIRALLKNVSLEYYLSTAFKKEDLEQNFDKSFADVVCQSILNNPLIFPLDVNEQYPNFDLTYTRLLVEHAAYIPINDIDFDEYGLALGHQDNNLVKVMIRPICNLWIETPFIYAYVHISGKLILDIDPNIGRKSDKEKFIYYLPVDRVIAYYNYEKSKMNTVDRSWLKCNI